MDPTRLGPYTIRRRLGRGGMGTVFEAVDEAGTGVAVKTLSTHLSDDEGLRTRFAAEIEALKALRHPGIVRLLAFGEEEGRPFFAMELVRGRSLEQILAGGRRFDWRETVAIATDVARALKSAHDQGIVHRDLKPANLLFPDASGPDPGVKLADFGIARLFGDPSQTRAGTVVGTAEYMAPEQAAGAAVDARVDLYALGLVMFAMLTGRPPFRGTDVSDVLRRQRLEQPPRVSAIVPDVPEAVDELIAKLLAKEPSDRPPNALAVARGLASLAAASPDTPLGDATPTADHTSTDPLSTSPTAAASRVTRGSEVDLIAVTLDSGHAADGTVALPEPLGTQVCPPQTARDGRSLHQRVTQPNRSVAQSSAAAANRFTTVEELQRADRAAAESRVRRERWVRLAAAACILAALLAGGVAFLRPLTADQIHDRIRAIADAPDGDLRDARPMIDLFLVRFAADPRAEWIRGLRHELDLDALERRVRRRPRADAVIAPIERDYRAATSREAESPLACLAALEAILTLHGADARAADADSGLWLDLVRRQIDRVAPLAAREREEDLTRARSTLVEADSLAKQAESAVEEKRAELLARRRELLEGLVEMYGTRPHASEAVAEARSQLDDQD